MERFGSDKPDTRFGMELVELTAGVRRHRVQRLQGPVRQGHPGARRRRHHPQPPRRRSPISAKRWGAKGLVWMRVERAALNVPVAKFLSDDELAALRRATGAQRATCCCSLPTSRAPACHVLGLLRLELGRPPVDEGGLQFLWVADFPLFEALDADGSPMPAHHPFTMPHPDDVHLLDTPTRRRPAGRPLPGLRPGLNGWELGSGSVRIHGTDVQRRIFALLGIDETEAQERVRFPARCLPLRRAAACRLRLRHRPAGGVAGGRGEHPRGHRVPQDAVGRRSADQAPTAIDADHLAELGLRLRPVS